MLLSGRESTCDYFKMRIHPTYKTKYIRKHLRLFQDENSSSSSLAAIDQMELYYVKIELKIITKLMSKLNDCKKQSTYNPWEAHDRS